MKKLLDFGNRYAGQSDWTDFALLKFCVCAIGLFIGTFVSAGNARTVRIIAAAVFAVTYVILMIRVFKVIKDRK